MARKPRIDFPGAWHHVMNRGARRAPIFRADEHCNLFLDTVAEATEAFEIEVHAYSLMPNHYHLLIRSRQGNLSVAMRHINGAYTLRLNRMCRWDGPVFRGRFKSQLVRDESRLPYILAYIHLNPLRANLVTRIDAECWTSHRSYLGRRYAPLWVDTGYFRELFGSAGELQRYVLALHRGKEIWPDELDQQFGFFLGHEEVARRHGQHAFVSRFLEPAKALELVTAITGSGPGDLCRATRGRGANPARRFAVWVLRRHTMATLREIGRNLSMTPGQAANVLSRFDSSTEPFSTWIDELDDICDM